MPEAPLLVWKDAEGGEITFVNAAAFTADLLEMSKKSVYHFDGDGIRQSYERREITKVKWIDGDSNPADSMTKSKASTALKKLIDTNYLELQTMEWVG